MKQVKGASLVHFVKTIRANKSGVYNSYFKEEDLEVINKKVHATIWYPYDLFRRSLSAVFEVIGKKDPEKVKEWGRMYAEAIMTEMFKSTIKQNNPLEHIKRVPVYISTFYDFGNTTVTVENPKCALLELKDYDPDFALLYILLCGWFQRMAELCGAKNVQCEIIDKSWEKKTNSTTYRITWA